MIVTDRRSRVGAEAQREEVERHEAGDGDGEEKSWDEGFHRSDSRFGAIAGHSVTGDRSLDKVRFHGTNEDQFRA